MRTISTNASRKSVTVVFSGLNGLLDLRHIGDNKQSVNESGCYQCDKDMYSDLYIADFDTCLTGIDSEDEEFEILIAKGDVVKYYHTGVRYEYDEITVYLGEFRTNYIDAQGLRTCHSECFNENDVTGDLVITKDAHFRSSNGGRESVNAGFSEYRVRKGDILIPFDRIADKPIYGNENHNKRDYIIKRNDTINFVNLDMFHYYTIY